MPLVGIMPQQLVAMLPRHFHHHAYFCTSNVCTSLDASPLTHGRKIAIQPILNGCRPKSVKSETQAVQFIYFGTLNTQKLDVYDLENSVVSVQASNE